MTGGEQLYIRLYNAVDSIVKNSGAIAQLGLAATGTAILTQTLVTAVAYTLDLYRGDITIDEFKTKIVAVAVTTGITAPIFFVILIAVLALFPELTVLLAAPAVVAGFNALFGVLPYPLSNLFCDTWRQAALVKRSAMSTRQCVSKRRIGLTLRQTTSDGIVKPWFLETPPFYLRPVTPKIIGA
jgi:hypothetical protein